MLEDFQEENRKRTARIRSFMDTVMGILLIFMGLYFVFYRNLGINVFKQKPSDLDYAIGGLFIIYGAWRIYRGYKKDYFR